MYCSREYSKTSRLIQQYEKSTLEVLKFISFCHLARCTEPPQQTGCDPSLTNEPHPVVARHPSTSLPVHHPQEAIPKSTNGSIFPPCLGPPPFEALINMGLAGGTTFPCLRFKHFYHEL